jgi:hypothetical protein
MVFKALLDPLGGVGFIEADAAGTGAPVIVAPHLLQNLVPSVN